MARNLNAARILTAGLMTALAFGLVSLSASAQQFINISYLRGQPVPIPNSINNHVRDRRVPMPTRMVCYHGFYLLNARYTALNVPARHRRLPRASTIWEKSSEDLLWIVVCQSAWFSVRWARPIRPLISPAWFTPGPTISITWAKSLGTYANAGSNALHGFTLKAGVFTPIDAPGCEFRNISESNK